MCQTKEFVVFMYSIFLQKGFGHWLNNTSLTTVLKGLSRLTSKQCHSQCVSAHTCRQT